MGDIGLGPQLARFLNGVDQIPKLPVADRGQQDEIMTQYAMKDVEKIGLIKFDFLGLKTLTFLQAAEELVRRLRRALPTKPRPGR